jgi:hypothetical protein
MAVTTQYGTEYTSVYQSATPSLMPTSTWGGRVRSMFFSHTQDGAGDAGSSVALVQLPPGTVRLLLPYCTIYANWTTASATLDLGWDAYTDLNGDTVAADPDGLINGISVDSAGVFAFEELTASAGAGATTATGYTKVFSSKDPVVIRATSTDTAIADGDLITGILLYVAD